MASKKEIQAAATVLAAGVLYSVSAYKDEARIVLEAAEKVREAEAKSKRKK